MNHMLQAGGGVAHAHSTGGRGAGLQGVSSLAGVVVVGGGVRQVRLCTFKHPSRKMALYVASLGIPRLPTYGTILWKGCLKLDRNVFTHCSLGTMSDGPVGDSACRHTLLHLPRGRGVPYI